MVSETDVFLGPNTDEGMSAKVVHGYNTQESNFIDTYVIYHVSGIEDIQSRVPEAVCESFGGLVTIEFVNGTTTQIPGAIETVKE